MTKDAPKAACRTTASLLIVLVMLTAWMAPASAQQDPSEQDLPTVTILKAADQIIEGSTTLAYRLVIDPAQSNGLLVHLESEQTGSWVMGTLDGAFNLTIPAGRSQLDFGLPVVNDAIVEADGSVTITVNPGADYQVGTENSVTVDILDNDQPVTVEFLADEELEVAENAGFVEVVVVATVDGSQRPGTYAAGNATYEGQEFSISTRSGTATPPSDFDTLTRRLLLPIGSFTQQESGDYVAMARVFVSIRDDDEIEYDPEQFTVILERGPSTGALTLPSEPLRIVILDNDSPDQPGVVSFSPSQPNAGVKVQARLSDLDGGVNGTAWQWSRGDSPNGPFNYIDEATERDYTPTSEDVGKFLKTTVDYSDNHGPEKSASATTTEAVLGGRCEFDAPNDASTTLSLEPGRSVSSYFCDLDDVDWVSLWLTAGQAYRIAISHPHDEYTPRIAGVFDADSQLFTGTHSYTGNPYATPRPPGTITFRATVTGTYYLEVKAPRCCIPPRLSPPERYDVTLTVADAPADDVPDVEEVMLEFNNFGVKVAELNRSIETEGDRDTFLLHARAGHRYYIRMRSHPGPHGYGGIFECIHGIAPASEPDQPRRGSRQCAHRPRWVVEKFLIPTADESFLITVGSDEGTGGYTLLIRDQTSNPPTVHDTPLPESDLASDNSTNGRVYVNDSWINGTAVLGEIDLAYDQDWYRVDLVAGVRYQIDIINEPNSGEYGIPVTLHDPEMWLHDADGQYIEGTYDDNGGFTFSALLSYTPTRTGTYYIAVGARGQQIGTYAVSVIDLNDTGTVHRPPEGG